jgi:quercetin dioxygenase-like cupin family protein
MNDEPLEQSLGPLSDLVSYQSGAIVSRTLLKGAGGNVTLFAFDLGEKLSEHSTPHGALVYLVEGEMEITIGTEPNTLSKGEILLLPATIPHSVLAKSQSKMLLVMVMV